MFLQRKKITKNAKTLFFFWGGGSQLFKIFAFFCGGWGALGT
jgi:hypothetical protein